jgi:hypothetical protein
MHFSEVLVKAPLFFGILFVPGGSTGFLWMLANHRKLERQWFHRLQIAAKNYKDALDESDAEVIEEKADQFNDLAANPRGGMRFWLWPALEIGVLLGALISIPLTLISCAGLAIGGDIEHAMKLFFDWIVFPGSKLLFLGVFVSSSLTLLNDKSVSDSEILSVVESIPSDLKKERAKQLVSK